MALKKIDVDAKGFKKLIGSQIVYTVHRPFSSRTRRESVYMGTLVSFEGNNIAINEEKDLIKGRQVNTKVRSFMELEEVYLVK